MTDPRYCVSRIMLTKSVTSTEIDVCKGCQAIWLDAGELEAIIARKQQLDGEAITASPRPSRQSATIATAVEPAVGDPILAAITEATMEQVVGGIVELIFSG